MVKLIAHRGRDDEKYGANTLDAIKDSLVKKYIDGIEIDIRRTKDQQFVLIHDNVINLVSDGTGFVNQMTLSNLQKYNFGTEINPSKITTLEDVLSLDTDKIILIEIKDEPIDYKDMLDHLYHKVKDSKLNLYFVSFHHKVIEYLYKKYPILKVGIIIGYALNEDEIENKYDINIVRYRNLDHLKMIKPTFVWTINDKREYQEIKKKYHDLYIITDKSTKLYKNN